MYVRSSYLKMFKYSKAVFFLLHGWQQKLTRSRNSLYLINQKNPEEFYSLATGAIIFQAELIANPMLQNLLLKSNVTKLNVSIFS